MKKHDSPKLDRTRRQFLMMARGVGALGAIAVLFGKGAAAQAAPPLPAANKEPRAGGYRDTAHIRKYYRSARYW